MATSEAKYEVAEAVDLAEGEEDEEGRPATSGLLSGLRA